MRASSSEAFAYAGVDLVYAVERDLFMSITNDQKLHAAFAALDAGGVPPSLTMSSDIERRVAEAVLGGAAQVRIADRSNSGPSLRTRAGGVVRRYRATRSTVAPPAAPTEVKVCFLIKHSKFLRYVTPVVEHLGADACVALVVPESVPAAIASGLHWRLYEPHVIPADDLGAMPEGLRENQQVVRDYVFLLRTLRELRPACVVVIEGNAPSDEAANQAARSLNIPCLCIQQGWAPMIHTGFRNMSYSAMAVWGEGFKALLEPFNPAQLFQVTGSIGLDARHDAAALSRSAGSPPTALFALQVAAPTIPDSAMRSFLRLIDNVAERCPEARVLVRDHPGHGYARSSYGWNPKSPAVALVGPDQYGLAEVLTASDVVVAISSTTLLEGVAMLRPAVVVNETSVLRHSPDLDELGVGIEVKSADDAVETIARLLLDESFRSSFLPAMRLFRERYFDGLPEASERVAASIDDLSSGMTRESSVAK
jgi:hypothetical protein